MGPVRTVRVHRDRLIKGIADLRLLLRNSEVLDGLTGVYRTLEPLRHSSLPTPGVSGGVSILRTSFRL